MLLTQSNTKHINTLTHEGKVLIVASLIENGQTGLYYTVKQDGFEDSALQNPNGTGWEAFKKVELPNDSVGDPSVEEKEQAELTDKNGKYLLRSLYKSANLTADAPVQLVSHEGHVYFFRQSTRGTLLVDRFVLDGMANTLTPKLEVRFKRSRQRYKPLKAMKISSGGQMESVDSLDFRDMQNRPFYEPTTELCPEILNNLENGWFGVVVTPTNEQESYRWHILAYNRASKKVDLLTLRAGSEQMFEVQDYWFRTVDPVTDIASYDSIPGLIRRELELQDSDGKPLAISNGLAAIKYDVQREQQTQNGPQLVRDASKILLAVPTEWGVAALSFAIANDGRLAQIAPDTKEETLRSQERDILLPLNLLDSIRPVGDSSPAPAGTIAGMSRSTEDSNADRVQVQVSAQDKTALKKLKNGDLIKLSNTVNYNGLYRVGAVKGSTFTIDASFKFGEVGDWEKVEEEETGLVFDGLITGYEKSGDGKLTINAANHGLAAGDLVQIVGSTVYDGEYPILKHDEDSFTVQRLWVNGEAVNITLESRKRRGLVFNGKQDWIEVPLSQPLKLSGGFTLEAWVKLSRADNQTLIATGPAPFNLDGAALSGYQVALSVYNGHFTLALYPFGPGVRATRLESSSPAPLNEWVHVACTFDSQSLQLLENGVEKGSLPAAKLLDRATTAYEELVKALREEKEKQEAVLAQSSLKPNHPLFYDAGKLVVRNGGQVISAESGEMLALATLGEQPEQRWRIVADGDAFIIRNLVTGSVLDDRGRQSAWQQADSQRWKLEATPDGYYTLRSKSRGMMLEAWQGAINLGNAWPLNMPNSWNQQWSFVPLGESKINRARAAVAAVEAAPPQKSAPMAINVKMLTLASRAKMTMPNNQLTDLDELLQGQLADVRLWTIGRTSKEISNTMYLQLTGRETGLAGYWRLGGLAVTEDGSQTAFDFSVNANHGLGYGAPYAGGITLGRTLRDGKTEAVKFCNSDLVAVREGVSYVESFEFKADKNVDPGNADGKEARLFKPSLWGRLSRNAEENQSFSAMQENYQFDDLGGEWYRATCRFIIPEGVRLLRCFELGEVCGEWNTLEIRRHSLRLVSDTVTQSRVSESARLTTLASPLPTLLPGDKEKFQARQQLLLAQKPALEARHKELGQILGLVTNRTEAEQKRSARQDEIKHLTEQRNSLETQQKNAAANPRQGEKQDDLWDPYFFDALDYVDMAEVVCPAGKIVIGIQFYRKGNRLAPMLHCVHPDGSGGAWVKNETLAEDQYFRHKGWGHKAAVRCPAGKIVTGFHFYELGNRVAFKLRCANPDGSDQQWLENTAWDGNEFGLDQYAHTAPVMCDPANQVVTGFALYRKGNRIAPMLYFDDLTEAYRLKQALNNTAGELANTQAQLDYLNQYLSEGERKRAEWEKEWADVRGKLAALEPELAEITRRLAVTAHPAELLRQIDVAEREEAPLVARQKELERLIGDIANRVETERKRNEQQNLVNNLTWERSDLETRYSKAVDNPPTGEIKNEESDENVIHMEWYIHTAPILCPPGKRLTGIQFYRRYNRLTPKIRCAYADGSGEQWIEDKELWDGYDAQHQDWIDTAPVRCPKNKVVTGVQLYKKGNRTAIKIRCANPDGSAEEWVDNPDWNETNVFRSRYSEINDFIDMHPITSGQDQVVSGVQIWKKGNRLAPMMFYYSTTEMNSARSALDNKIHQLNLAQAELDRLNQALNASNDQLRLWQNELNDINERLKNLRLRLSALQTAYLDIIAKANTTAQTMPDLPDQEDPRGLKVQGALLSFADAATRLHALESCTGRVSLTFQDRDGSVRQSHYDTAYDADGKGEEWLADKYRAALFLDGSKPALPLPASIFSDLNNQVTIEFWAKGGSQLPKACALIGAFGANNQPRLLIQLPNEKGEVIWEAGLRPDNGTLDSLVHLAEPKFYRERWTHWAFVKDGDQGELRIYINGKLWHKNNPKAKDGGAPLNQSLAGITEVALGGFPRQTPNWHGQLAELRIWNVALGEREIEANSVLTLSGNEPGLVAYYPFNEAQGDTARDQTGHGQHLNIAGCAWVPCTAPIGRLTPPPLPLLNQTMPFNGQDVFVQLPGLDLDCSEGITLEARVRFDQFNQWSRLVDLGNGPGKQNILLANKESSKHLIFQVHNDQKLSELECPVDLPQGEWVHVAATIQKDGTACLYLNGVEKARGKMALPQKVVRSSNYIGKSNWPDKLFQGEMAYVRLWESALSAEEIKSSAEGGVISRNVISAEYSRIRVDAQKRKAVMMLRCLAMTTAEGVRLVDEQRIEELEMKWIGNAQIKPTLIGYIEGAPPLPSENLTEEKDYNGATSVELIQSSDVEYSWTREQDVSFGGEVSLFMGVDTETFAGVGVATQIEGTHAGATVGLDFAYHWQNASTVGASHSLMSSDRLELRGSQEPEAHFPYLGQRFIPKNIGYALVTSGLADVFVSKLKRSGRMIGYQILPVEGVPPDVNTITFLINPAYTMAGSLDGLTGSQATSDRFFRHVPEMRSQYGSLYPASYFRLKEAYDLKAQIDEQDKLHQAYFNQFNAGLVDQTSLNRQLDDTGRDGGTVGLNSPDRSGGENNDAIKELDRKIEAKQKEIDELKKATPVNQAEVDKQQNELNDLKQQKREKEQAGRTQEGEQRQNEIAEKHTDLSARANASESFAGWQRKMENLQVRAGKRNIVNTYVWDGDGGFHAEEQQFASTVEHSIGGSFDLGFAIGGEGEFAVGGVDMALSAQAKVNLTQTMSKTERSSKGLELHVDLSGVESRGITDYRDYPILPGEKVDRYRFMSFFLEGSTNHWHDFFTTVVDPEWLASNDEEARALREAQSALPNKVWRVLHRVTYVERPALMGFGRSTSTRVEAADDIRELRQQMDDLNARLIMLQKEVNHKLDQLLSSKV